MKRSKAFSYWLGIALIFTFLIWGAVFDNISADSENKSKIYFLDVGQGDSALLTLPDSVQVLVDTGRGQKASTEISKYMPFFDKKIEYVMITHFDSDHFGGLDEILRSYQVEKIMYPLALESDEDALRIEAEAEKFGYQIKKLSQGEAVYFKPSYKAEVLWPRESGEGLKGNDLSLVMMVEGDKKILMTGDIEIEGQKRLLDGIAEDRLKADVLKFPHHGAEGSFHQRFLEIVDPKQVIISVGKNSYGHPSQKIIEYFENLTREIFRTDVVGTVEMAL